VRTSTKQPRAAREAARVAAAAGMPATGRARRRVPGKAAAEFRTIEEWMAHYFPGERTSPLELPQLHT
jgi:hypothetical protein